MENIQALLESSKYANLSASDSAAMKLMLENTEKEYAKLVAEGTLTGDVAQFTPILMPMVRRVYPTLIANEILGVQPMTMPTGFIYALVNQYTGTGVYTAPDSSESTTRGIVITYTFTPGTGETQASVAVGKTITGNVTGSTGVIAYLESDTNRVTGAVTYKALVNVATYGTAGLTTADVAATLDGLTGTLSINALYSNEASFGKILRNYTGPVATGIGETLSTNMKEVGFSVSKKSVEAQTRALKGRYTVEMYQDLKAQHGLLADEELMSLISYEMQAEIDREVVTFVNDTAALVANTPYGFHEGSTGNGTDGIGRWEIEKYRVESIRFSKEATRIGIDTKRGQGNVLLVSPKVATMMEQIGSFKPAPVASGVVQPVAGGVAGTFDSKFKVIVDQYATSDYATVLYKGADRRDGLGFFAPYVPMSFTKVTDPESGQPAVIAKTRYALTTIPGLSSAASTDRAATYARTWGIDFSNTVLA